MSNYKHFFKQILEQEQPNFDIRRNPTDANFDYETDPNDFNVEPMDANVGFQSTNISDDTEELKQILKDINGMAESMQSINFKIVKLRRTFSDIGKVSDSIAKINENLRELVGKLEGYVISLPAQKDKEEKDQATEVMPGEY